MRKVCYWGHSDVCFYNVMNYSQMIYINGEVAFLYTFWERGEKFTNISSVRSNVVSECVIKWREVYYEANSINS